MFNTVQIVLLCGSDRTCVVYIELYTDRLFCNVLVGDCVQIVLLCGSDSTCDVYIELYTDRLIGNVLVGDWVHILCKMVNQR
jgi:hypothetical protein